MSTSLIRISEIFGPTIQGEGAVIGQPSIFVRTGGCDYRCRWCDTLHAVDSAYRSTWQEMSAQDVLGRVEELSGGKPLLVSLSGGNPAIQPLGALIRIGQEKGYRFALETQGSVAQDWFTDLDVLTLSPKPPSSGEETEWTKFDDCLAAAKSIPETSLKIVVFDEDDYAYAREVAARIPQLPVYLQVGSHQTQGAVDKDALTRRYDWLMARAFKDQWYEVKILPQLHVMLWGNKRGV